VPGVPQAEKLNGKELSYNNLLDCDAAWRLVSDFDRPTAVVIKHTNPCGAASAETLSEAWDLALAGDPVSAFGSIVAVNRPLDADTAEKMAGPNTFLEAVLAPAFDAAALEVLTTKPKWGKNVRILQVPTAEGGSARDIRSVRGGYLVQDEDRNSDDGWEVAAGQPADEAAYRFAWTVCKHVKSNAIVITSGSQLVGVGAGQMSRVDAARIAVEKAGERAQGGIAASDAFFPFPDGVEVLAQGGVSGVIQPGGSRRDEEVISYAKEAGVAMVLTGTRHFRH
jgi:phosphoribosylaminoimidazolecarboxamide formyltransferase/IMP cyclohydrolase